MKGKKQYHWLTKEFKSYWYRRRHGNLTEGLKGCIFWKDSSLDCDDKVDDKGDWKLVTLWKSQGTELNYIYYNLLSNYFYD